MGIVASQSVKNITSTYLGFFIGAINTLFLFTKYMSDEYYGMVGFMLSLATVIMPVMSFGVPNTIVKFYSSFKTRVSLNSFLTLMLFLPILVTIPLTILVVFSYNIIADFLTKENAIIENYLWHTFIIAIALAYFEVFFAWAKVQMQTVFGNFMKEVFHRVGAMILLFLLHFEVIDVEQFMKGLVLVYIIRMLIMKLYAFSIKWPVLTFKKVNNLSSILKYSFLIIIAGSVASVLLDVDKVMIGYFMPIGGIAYYNVAIYIAMVIAVPQRSMHQILLPLSAKYINEKDIKSLDDLSKRSSLTLFVVSGLIFLLIVLNINQLYLIVEEEYSQGLFVVLIISLAKLYDALLGSNNAILFNSDYYRMVLLLGVVLVVLMVLLNIVFISLWGINGAALATFFAMFLYNTIKLIFVYRKFKILPFTMNTVKTGAVIVSGVLLFYFWDFPFHPIVNIGLKSTLIGLSYVYVIHKFKLSDNISSLLDRFIKLN
ncbi:lipopolysaccharide biosynthesis protein [Aestuariibaculum suncheonense]|uniref:Polysaccharide biosynthesis C-terminal domain-containing protein n=1 Tax=Aestuariibaculum suncheonense TaxID=1028745 RepID=A0A8J6Q8M9_9FLAO|nr:polysaccharide biosynthesis C-terminal domain-containing protein [Aestuariibaculum suncheonense]MBD0835285.1 polysaccharide biosynthesis C-terminal domain-containing protein [Aestuariibaculum suncheonense]